MKENPSDILRTSQEPGALSRAAAELASSDKAADQQALRAALGSERFLLRLNTTEEYRGQPKDLRLKSVMDPLAANPSPVARETLLALIKDPIFLKEGGRVDLLIAATGVVRPAPEELVDFWDKRCRPEDGYTPLTIEAAVENASAPALEFLARKFADPAHEEDSKRAWMRNDILPRRDRENLLALCERLLKKGLPNNLRGDLVDVLFDYKPAEWYRPASSRNPPPWPGYTAEAREVLRRIADYVLHHVELKESQKAAVRQALHSLANMPSLPPDR